ncbi:MAG: hypothetical protein SGARI_008158, partial [Bacillariaceae sp.]
MRTNENDDVEDLVKLISFEFEEEGLEQGYHDNINVVVELENGEVYMADFYTISGIRKAQESCQRRGFYLGGKYLCGEFGAIILIDRCYEEDVVAVVYDILKENR